jgi:transposase
VPAERPARAALRCASEQISPIGIDMFAAFINGCTHPFPNVRITFDKSHVIRYANTAVRQDAQLRAVRAQKKAPRRRLYSISDSVH